MNAVIVQSIYKIEEIITNLSLNNSIPFYKQYLLYLKKTGLFVPGTLRVYKNNVNVKISGKLSSNNIERNAACLRDDGWTVNNV